MQGATWGDDGTIVWAPSPNGGLWIAEPDEEPRALTVPQGREHSHVWPRFVPQRRAVLFTWRDLETGVYSIDALDLESERRSTVVENAVAPRFVPRHGQLLFAQGDLVLAAPFDPETLRLTGDPIPVLDGFATLGSTAHFDVSDNGTLVTSDYRLRTDSLVWRSLRAGAEDQPVRFEVIDQPHTTFGTSTLSPDGRFVLLNTWGNDIQVLDLERGTSHPVNQGYDAVYPVWMPDSRSLLFTSGAYPSDGPRQGRHLFRAPIDRHSPPERLTTGDAEYYPTSVTADGRFVAITLFADGRIDLYVLPLLPDADGARRARPLVVSPASETSGVFSPDGRWIAWISDEVGDWEIYVSPFDADSVLALAPDGPPAPWPATRCPRVAASLRAGRTMVVPSTTAKGSGFYESRSTPVRRVVGQGWASPPWCSKSPRGHSNRWSIDHSGTFTRGRSHSDSPERRGRCGSASASRGQLVHRARRDPRAAALSATV